MDFQKEKEAFEAWFESRYDAHFMQFALDLDFYVDKHTQTCWEAWQAKAQAVLEKDAIIQKLSDQLYAQEMKTSGARVLCETACELLDGYAHQDAMVIINDLEQAMKEPAND